MKNVQDARSMVKYIKPTRYYDEFLHYFKLASKQQEECNLGTLTHTQSTVEDDLMKHVELYDVVERKYAGFSQIVNDIFYGWTEEHPYWNKMKIGMHSKPREIIAKNWTGKKDKFGLVEWLYVFLFHRLTGSGINYAYKPSGYYNTMLFDLHKCDDIPQMIKMIKTYHKPFYTSVGYQFPAFPKPTENYKRGGDYFLCEFAPKLAEDVAKFLEEGPKKDIREIGDFMFKWNVDHGFRQYKFQYAAFISDICDWFPQYVNRESLFYYGSNAKECISYLAEKGTRMQEEVFLDAVMMKIYDDTGSLPYNAEDVACDFIRWIENYVKPGKDYAHLNYDEVWNSSSIKDHPYGRQKAMLDLGLVKTFKYIEEHPSDDKVLKEVSLTEDQYKQKVKEYYEQHNVQ